jgi:CBS domain-containing protein
MDGGRMLRAALASRMHPVRATRAAATVGQTFAFLFGIAGLFGNPMLLLIALFVWIGAGQEAALAEMRFGFGSTPVSAIMLDQVRTLSPGDTLESAVDLTLHGWQQDFPVVEQGQLVGMLNRSDLLPALAGEGPTFPVEKAMQRQFLSAEPQEPLHSVIAKLQQCRCRSLAVVEKGRLVGLLAAESVGDFLRIQNALHSGRRA